MVKKIAAGIISTSVNVVAGLVRNKILAIYLSLNLFGIVSLGQQAASLLFTIFSFGLPMGITTLAAELTDRSVEEQRQTLSRAFVLAVISSATLLVLIGIVILVDPEIPARFIGANEVHTLAIAIILLSCPLMILQNSLYAMMEGMGRLRQIVLFKTVPALLMLAVIFALVTRYHLVGASIGMVLGEFLLVATGCILLRKSISLSKESFNMGPVFLKVFKVAVLSFLVGASWLLVDFLVKRYVLTLLGEMENGVVQSVAKITDLYPTIALSWLAMHLFPSLGKDIGNRPATAAIIERTLLIAEALVIPLVLLLFAFRTPILDVIYTRDFAIASDYFAAMLVTGVLKVYAWVLGVGLLAAGLRREWMYSSVVLAIVYLVYAWVGLITESSIMMLPVALGIALVVQSVYSVLLFRAKGYHFSRSFKEQTLYWLAIALSVLGALFFSPALVVSIILFGLAVIRFNLVREVREKVLVLKDQRRVAG